MDEYITKLANREKEIAELKNKINSLELKVHVLEVANDDLAIGHNRYEKLRRLNLEQIKELYLKNLRTGEHFDTLVDKLCQVK